LGSRDASRRLTFAADYLLFHFVHGSREIEDEGVPLRRALAAALPAAAPSRPGEGIRLPFPTKKTRLSLGDFRLAPRALSLVVTRRL